MLPTYWAATRPGIATTTKACRPKKLMSSLTFKSAGSLSTRCLVVWRVGSHEQENSDLLPIARSIALPWLSPAEKSIEDRLIPTISSRSSRQSDPRLPNLWRNLNRFALGHVARLDQVSGQAHSDVAFSTAPTMNDRSETGTATVSFKEIEQWNS